MCNCVCIFLDETCKEYYEDDWIWGEEASGEEETETTEEDEDEDGSGSGSGDKGTRIREMSQRALQSDLTQTLSQYTVGWEQSVMSIFGFILY